MNLLVVNAGSSSFKMALYEIPRVWPKQPVNPVWTGLLDWGKNKADAALILTGRDGNKIEQKVRFEQEEQGMNQLIDQLVNGPAKALESLNAIQVVGHRVVHGGESFYQPVLITPEVKTKLADLIPLAPLHNPANLKGIEVAESRFPSIPQVAVFDTAFHHTIPKEASTYAGPYQWLEEGIKRYGFHGISHQYCSEQAQKMVPTANRIVSCHLGNGASLAAILNGISHDTTMGFTPLEGLMMGSRCGSIDPSILLYLGLEKKISQEELQRILNEESGLKGISGVSEDMRTIIEFKESGDQRAVLAWNMYLHSLKRNIGAMTGVLGGLDVLIFTGGIGENSVLLREEACRGLAYLGIKLDEEKNLHCVSDQTISSIDSKVQVLCIHTHEDWCIARDCVKFINLKAR